MAFKQFLSLSLYICLLSSIFCTIYFIEGIIPKALICIFIIRYFRLTVGIFSYFLHQSVQVPNSPNFFPKDVVAILPTVNPQSHETLNTILSVLDAGVAHLIVVTPVSKEKEVNFLRTHQDLVKYLPLGILRIEVCLVANKRRQVSIGLDIAAQLNKSIVVLVDDHVYWPSGSAFLPNILAPFENSKVGGVAMWKNVIRNTGTIFSPNDFWNFIGCLYLERHNFDITASHFVDGGLFVISGRTAAYRSSIICNSEFIQEFCNERWWCFGSVGPLNADDDNFITRWLVNRKWEIGWQHGPDATMVTTVGDSGFEKFNSQCLRWARTTWRSNSTSLLADRKVYAIQPWSVYSVYLTSFINFALFMDTTLLYLSWQYGSSVIWFIASWILCSKLVKPLPHFIRYPRDLIYLFPYMVFGYYHSLLKLYALFTVRTISWGSRPGVVG